jgi:hypothetical protein
MRRAGTTNTGTSSNDNAVICQEIPAITTSVRVSVTRLDTTPESVSENARWAPITSLPSRLTSAPVRVRVAGEQRPGRLGDRHQGDDARQQHHRAGVRAGDDRVDHLAGHHRGGHGQQRAEHADRHKYAQPAVMPSGEAPNPADQAASH